MPRMPIAIVAALALPAFAGGDLAFVVDQNASSVLATTSLLADSEGTLIGDFDAATNPVGTQTRPGFFGGSGNNPIPLSLDVLSSTTIDTSPSGAFDLAFDTDALTFDISALALDLISAGVADSGIDVTLEWSTFNTINPTFIFPGGVPITLPISTSQLTALSLAQTAPSALPGVLTPAGVDTFTMLGAVPVSLTISADSATFPLPETVFDAVLPLTGQLVINPDASASVTLTIDLADLSQLIDLSATPPVENIPLELPTLGADTASVLLSLQFAGATINATGAINIVANGQSPACNAADLAEPLGTLDFSDVIAFLTLFSAGDPAADLAPPTGVFDFSDVIAFLGAFAAGCP